MAGGLPRGDHAVAKRVGMLWALAVSALAAGCARASPLSVCLPPDGRFELHYVHSVERTPVVERYRIAADGSLWLEGMRFRSAGWGSPHQGYRRRGTWFETTTPPVPVSELVLRVSRLARHQIRVGEYVLAVADRLPEGTAVRVEVHAGAGCPVALSVRPVR